MSEKGPCEGQGGKRTRECNRDYVTKVRRLACLAFVDRVRFAISLVPPWSPLLSSSSSRARAAEHDVMHMGRIKTALTLLLGSPLSSWDFWGLCCHLACHQSLHARARFVSQNLNPSSGDCFFSPLVLRLGLLRSDFLIEISNDDPLLPLMRARQTRRRLAGVGSLNDRSYSRLQLRGLSCCLNTAACGWLGRLTLARTHPRTYIQAHSLVQVRRDQRRGADARQGGRALKSSRHHPDLDLGLEQAVRRTGRQLCLCLSRLHHA